MGRTNYILKVGIFSPLALTSPQSSVTKDSITWTFDTTYDIGQFVNGDYFVINPGGGVIVSSVSPAQTTVDSRVAHGSMVNPSGFGWYTNQTQGYFGTYAGNMPYSSGDSVTFPKTLGSGDSLVSTETAPAASSYTDVYGFNHASGGSHHRNKATSVLTCLASVPYADQFRPPSHGTSKPVYRESEINTGLLPSITLGTGQPSTTEVDTIADMFVRPWIENGADTHGRSIHPTDNQPAYGQHIAGAISRAAILLSIDFSLAEKRDLMLGLIQVGIDIYHCALLGHNWEPDAGHSHGRLFPILFAGTMLNHSGMKNIRTTYTSRFKFSELGMTNYTTGHASSNDGQTYRAVWGAWESLARGNADYYRAGCTGGGSKSNVPDDNADDGCASYRQCCTSLSWVGMSLVSKIMGITALYDHDAFFDYVDRWMGYGLDPQVDSQGHGVSAGAVEKVGSNIYVGDLWDQERANY